MQTWLGAITLQIPQVRDASFCPRVLERGLRSERALHLARAELVIDDDPQGLAAAQCPCEGS